MDVDIVSHTQTDRTLRAYNFVRFLPATTVVYHPRRRADNDALQYNAISVQTERSYIESQTYDQVSRIPRVRDNRPLNKELAYFKRD